MDEMGRKVDDLERSVGDLVEQAGLEKAAGGTPNSQPPSTADGAPSAATAEI